ncbi:MAG: efflux RND transporter periplasmic adaptor subunit, partial [Burkholderiales bacterium]|nr:efflux RND transporter periplasmic adaptor subunit [Burkholderiales bacterium]
MKNKKAVTLSLIVVCIVALGSAVWWKKNSGEGTELLAGQALGGKGENKSKPVNVNTIIAQQRDYAVRLTANGVVTSLNVVEVRPQISSVIEKVHIKEGQFVRAGDLLFTLDHRTESSNLAKADAQLSKELATLAELQRQATRSRELFDKKFQSQSVLDSSQAALQAQQAVVDAAKASVVAAKVNLTYSKIVAPASGRTGLINVFAGSLVQPSSAGAALVTITQMDPIAIT